MTQIPDVTEYLDYDEDELFEELGAQLLGGGIGAAPRDPDQNGRYGRRWFESRLDQIREQVCGNQGVEVIRTDQMRDPLLQVATVSDCVASLSGKPAAAVLATLILKVGLNTLCAGR